MSQQGNSVKPPKKENLGRRSFLYTMFGGAIAALSGWVAGAFPRNEPEKSEETSEKAIEAHISVLEAKIAELERTLTKVSTAQPLAQLEGEKNERIVFNKSELSVINPEGVLLNLVAVSGHVGIRFYKDFGFGNEQVTNPWHMGYIENKPGYQCLAILRDWRFTAALWDEDGKLILGRLDPHPPANEPAKARLEIRGRLDEIQALIEASENQSADIFQVVSRDGTRFFSVDSTGHVVVGSPEEPKEVILFDTSDRSAYALKVADGNLILTKVERNSI